MKKDKRYLVYIGLFVAFIVFLIVGFLTIVYFLSERDNVFWKNEFNISMPDALKSEVIASDTNNFHGDGYEFVILNFDDFGIKQLMENNEWEQGNSAPRDYAITILNEMKNNEDIPKEEKKNIDKNWPNFNDNMQYILKEREYEYELSPGINTSIVNDRVVLALDKENKKLYYFGFYT